MTTFLEDFEEIVMMTQAASECKRILCDKKKNDIHIIDFDFDTLKLQYDPVNDTYFFFIILLIICKFTILFDN